MAAVSAQGSTVWVLIRRLNSSCNRSIAFEVRMDFHWLGGKRVNVKSLSPASSKLSATARYLRRHFRMNISRYVRSRFRRKKGVGVGRRRGQYSERNHMLPVALPLSKASGVSQIGWNSLSSVIIYS